MDLVSIIVPVYNAENTIRRCLDSIVSQEYKEFEIIIINDGSTDRSLAICEDYCSRYKNITVYNQINSGPAAARNTGITLAKGEFVYFVDADDYLESDLLKTMVSAAVNNHADMVICNYYIEKQNGQSEKHIYYCQDGLYEKLDVKELNIKLIDDVSPNRIPPYSWVRMIRKTCLDRTNTRFENGMIRSEDYHFFLRFQFEIDTIYVINKPLYHYVEISNSITHRYVPYYWDSVKLIYHSLNECLPKEEIIKERLDVMLIQRTMVALNNSSLVADRKIFKKEIFDILSDIDVTKSIHRIPLKKGFKKFRWFYFLMRFKCYPLIYARYSAKR